MNNQMERPRGHSTTYEEDHIIQDASTGVHIGHKDEDHGEKKSVLKKVKAKAKKIKDSIKEHVGHGHEVHDDHDDDEDDEMDMDPEIHNTHAVQSFVPGHEGVARQHEPKQGDRSTGQEGATVISKKGDDYQKFDPTTARSNPGQDETLGWSRTDTERPKEFEERPYAPRNTPIAAMHSREGHSTSTGNLDMGKKGPPAKYGGLVERLTDLENDPQAPKDVGEERHPANYQAKVADPSGNGNNSKPAQSYMQGIHRSKVGEKTPMGEMHAYPSSKPRSDYQKFDPTNTSCFPGQEETLGLSRTDAGIVKGSQESLMPGLHRSKQGVRTPMEGVIHADPSSRPQSGYQTLNPTTTSYVPGQEEIFGWSGTDTGTLKGSEESFMPRTQRKEATERTALEEFIHADPSSKPKPQGDYQTFDPTSISYVPGQEETLGWSRTDTGTLKGSRDSFTPGLHRSKLGERTAMEGVVHADPSSKPQSGYQTFDPTTTSYVPGQEETLGWSRTDIGTLKEELKEPSDRHSRKLGGILDSSEHLEKDPHAPTGPGEKRHADNYESKVTDPTGKGGEEIGVTPILHHLDRMNIQDESQQKAITSQQKSMFKPKQSPQDEKIFTGSHDQFSPEPVTSKTAVFSEVPESGSQFDTTSSGVLGSHDDSEQTQGSYTEKITSAAAMMADKAKQATSSVTSKLGYGGSSDQHSTSATSGPHDTHSESGGYGEKISNVTASITGKAVQAKDAVATKLGYGGTHERQPVQEGASKGGSNVETVTRSTVGSYVHGSEMGHEVDPSTTTGPSAWTDRGVSVKTFLAEKLKPGEEDKALAEVIADALPLHKHKEDVSGAVEEDGRRKVTIKGRVTESEEVARELGRSEETSYDDAGVGLASPGKGVMERIKDAAGAWFQKGGETLPKDATEGVVTGVKDAVSEKW